MDYLAKLRLQLNQAWDKMSLVQRVLLGLGVLAAGAALWWFGSSAFQTDYQVLYSQLPVEEAGAVTKYLDSQSITYRLEGGGTTILVPADKVNQARLALAVEGVPSKGGKGYELLDTFSIGTPAALQHINYLRALEGELARTIMQIEPVAFARVHIVLPESSPFLRDKKPTTASVMLRLKPGSSLHKEIARGIAALVARAVEGLTPENVTLLDASGRLLTESQDPELGGAASQLDHRRSMEKYLSSQAEDMLARVLGAGRAIVRVSVDMNFQHIKEIKETFDPEARAVKSEKITTNQSDSSNMPGIAGGKTGAVSNLPRPASGGGKDSQTKTQTETIETQYEVSRQFREFEDKVGAIERISIAALVDLDALAANTDGKSGAKMTLQDVEDLIKQAVCFKTNRDQIKVTEVHLNGMEDLLPSEEELIEQQRWQNILSIVHSSSIGLAALAGLMLGWMFLRRRTKPEKPAVAEPKVPAGSERILSRVSTMAQQDPQIFARVLSDWLEQSNGKHAVNGN